MRTNEKESQMLNFLTKAWSAACLSMRLLIRLDCNEKRKEEMPSEIATHLYGQLAYILTYEK